MGLFTGSDVEDRPRWWRNHWLLGLVTGGLPIDMAVGLMMGMPKLAAALEPTELPVPAATQLMIDMAAFLERAWWLVLPPLVVLPLLAAWKWREDAVPFLLIWLVILVAAFAAMCASTSMPIKTILDASNAI